MLTEIYCDIDDFMKDFEDYYKKSHLSTETNLRKVRKPELTPSEIMTIVIYFHLSHYRCFKHYYLYNSLLPSAFPDMLSYNRFVELSQTVVLPLIAYMLLRRLGKATGISFIDSTTLKVCLNQRINSLKRLRKEEKTLWVGFMALSFI